MKKRSFLMAIAIPILFSLPISSCKKEADEKAHTGNTEIEKKVAAWLQEKKAQFPTGKTNQEMLERLQLLQDNLDFEKTRYEQRSEEKNLPLFP